MVFNLSPLFELNLPGNQVGETKQSGSGIFVAVNFWDVLCLLEIALIFEFEVVAISRHGGQVFFFARLKKVAGAPMARGERNRRECEFVAIDSSALALEPTGAPLSFPAPVSENGER